MKNSPEKICFPYQFNLSQYSDTANTVVFFGTDFYNLTTESDQKIFAEKTDQMLTYIRTNFPHHKLLYQPHPNETDEHTHLNLERFTLGNKVIAELFLFEQREYIAYVFSACSGASISAYAMGFESAIFLDLLHGALPEDAITGFKSYFNGLPSSSFIQSFSDPLPKRESSVKELEESQNIALERIATSIGDTNKIWVLASDPALALRGALLIEKLQARNPKLIAGLLMISHRRWDLAETNTLLRRIFTERITLPSPRVWYSTHLKKIIHAIRVSFQIRSLPLEPGDTLLSFSQVLFEENCILSYHPQITSVLFLENRWYHFIYEEGSSLLDKKYFYSHWGTFFFNLLLEPILGLHRTLFKEYKDGKVVNLFRYRKPLQKIYTKVFVLMPDQFNY